MILILYFLLLLINNSIVFLLFIYLTSHTDRDDNSTKATK